jgi:L-aspartate oxidase
MRHVKSIDLHERFPGISAFLAKHDLDLKQDMIPVRPAAHYLMGGIRTDLDGRTNVEGLYAAGEVACTGVHGANRLASNSLLEGLVFGARAAKAMLADALLSAPDLGPAAALIQMTPEDDEIVDNFIQQLQTAMWADAGLLRHESTLLAGLSAQAECEAGLQRFAQQGKTSRRLLEGLALNSVSRVILISAMARNESRGAHFRNDHPHRDDTNFRAHSILTRDAAIAFEVW